MLNKLKDPLTAGTFTLSLPQCELRQCGSDAPRVYSGAGFVDQQDDGNLMLRMFAVEEIEEVERLKRLFPDSLTPGVLVPDSAYYDLTAVDQNGDTWRARRQSIKEIFGVGNEIHVPLRRLEKVETVPQSATTAGQRWFIPGEKLELPWHAQTRTPTRMSVDRFEFEDDDFEWRVHKVGDGLDVDFIVKRLPLEPHATRFLRALSMLLGQVLEPLVSDAMEGDEIVTLIHPRAKRPPARLVAPFETMVYQHEGPHRFLARCLHHAEQPHPTHQDQLLVLYRFWHRIANAHQSDIENSSLVLSVAIEGVIKTLCHSEHDADAGFVALVDAQRPKVEALDINERVRDSLLRSLTHSALPKPKDTLLRLKEQGVLTKAHVDAWAKMRNTGAHGAMLEENPKKFQVHLNRYFCCLDLFYRLAFLAVGYRGKFHDLSRLGWPLVHFLDIDAAPVEQGAASDQ